MAADLAGQNVSDRVVLVALEIVVTHREAVAGMREVHSWVVALGRLSRCGADLAEVFAAGRGNSPIKRVVGVIVARFDALAGGKEDDVVLDVGVVLV